MHFIQIEAPFKPDVTSATDVRNFDTDFTSEEPQLTPPDSSEFSFIKFIVLEEIHNYMYMANWYYQLPETL